MPRRPRIPSPTGIYHVMLRGINRSDIFLDEIDFMKMEKILRSLAKPVDKRGNPKQPICKIFAYCIMTNHIHLLIAEMDESISNIVKRLGGAYASYFNKRRNRTGPLFEGRFRSEPVNESEYFVTLLHYIHYNPVKAGMVPKPGWYKWSSMREYCRGSTMRIAVSAIPEKAEETDPQVESVPSEEDAFRSIYDEMIGIRDKLNGLINKLEDQHPEWTVPF